MRSQILSVALFSVAMLAAPGVSRAANDEQQIRKIEHEWLTAIMKRDPAFLQRLTDVFVKMNGEWKAVAAHVTAVSPEKK
jgi:hypothetical protein